jgi:hypothetical protein
MGRLGRKSLCLQMYELKIKYIPGEENSVADIESRPHRYALLVVTRKGHQRAISGSKQDYEPSYKDSTIDTYDDIPLNEYLKANF